MTCALIEEVCKRPGDIKDWAIDWRVETFRYRMPGVEYQSGVHLRPLVANGFEYQVENNGQSNEKTEPKWPTTLGETVSDGSLTLTCVALSSNGLRRTISTSTWNVENADIGTQGAAAVNSAGSQLTAIQVIGGTTGNTWDVENVVIFSDGVKLSAILRVTVDDEAD